MHRASIHRGHFSATLIYRVINKSRVNLSRIIVFMIFEALMISDNSLSLMTTIKTYLILTVVYLLSTFIYYYNKIILLGMEFQMLKNEKGKDMLCYNGYIFLKEKENDTKSIWKCNQY